MWKVCYFSSLFYAWRLCRNILFKFSSNLHRFSLRFKLVPVRPWDAKTQTFCGACPNHKIRQLALSTSFPGSSVLPQEGVVVGAVTKSRFHVARQIAKLSTAIFESLSRLKAFFSTCVATNKISLWCHDSSTASAQNLRTQSDITLDEPCLPQSTKPQ